MRHFYDCEFLEDGRTIDLISIAFVAEDGRELYMINAGFPLYRYNEDTDTARWLTDNVLPYLPVLRSHSGAHMWDQGAPEYVNHVFSRTAMKTQILDFMRVGPGFPELWANYGAYDHVALMQIFGQMMDRGPSMPMYTNDLQQLLRSHVVNPISLPQQVGGQHHALADARHLKACYDYAKGVINARTGMFRERE